MSNEIKEKAKEYLKLQISVIPTEEKKPALEWKIYQSERMKVEEVDILFSRSNVKGLGIVCGAINGNLEVIDVDTKHDKTSTLWDNLRGLIEDNLPEIYKSLVIAQTRNGGYHIYYRCSSISGNIPTLARSTTRESLIETRGEGGYVVAPPSPNYKYLQGDPSIIPTITPEDRNILFSIAQSFNELEEVKPKIPTISSNSYSSTGNSPFEDYNQRGDLLSLLESKGWKIVNQRGQNINILRPGDTDSKSSGNFNLFHRTLRVFSSSTEFNPDKAYSPAQAFSELECSGDNKLAYRKLLELGYGEAYKGEEMRSTQLLTQQIEVEIVNTINTGNRESSVISSPGESLKIETIENTKAQEIIINSPGSEAQEEVLKTLDFLQGIDKRIYINEGGVESRSYTYQLQAVFNKYGSIQETSGELSERNRDNFLDEVVAISINIQPLEKDIYLKKFLDLEPIKELGITAESLKETVDRLTSTIDKENQDRDLDKLLRKTSELRKEGKTKEALELLESSVKNVKQRDKATEFSKLLTPTSEDQMRAEESSYPESLISGINLGEEPLLLPSGALTIYAAPTNHGKTMLLINTALNVLDNYPDKKIIFFTYEERSNAIIQYFLNTYIDINLNSSSSTNRRIIKDHYRTGSTEFISYNNLEFFKAKKEEFFKTYIETGRLLVKYVEFNSEELTSAIEYLQQKDKSLGGVFIDYIQLLNLPENKEKFTRQGELSKICSSLKVTSVRTGLPFVLAAQFNRDVKALTRMHPSTIREAGDIEHSANVIVGFWNMQKETVDHILSTEEKVTIAEKITKSKLDGICYTGSSIQFMYGELLKSREQATGSYSFLELNGNTGKIKNRGDIKVEVEETVVGGLKKITRKKRG
jgi:replicative DNA helicase